jgi:hypothetical protein
MSAPTYTIGEVAETAAELLSETPGENSEYDRALIEPR